MPLLIHFTDTHLYGNPECMLKSISTHASCAAVLEMAHQAMPHADAVILGGDMSQDDSAASYKQLSKLLAPWEQTPFMLSPGNHANMDMLNSTLIPALKGISDFHDQLHLDHWHIISLNSHAPGQVAGTLSDEELQRLDVRLADAHSRHTLLAIHHPPVPTGSRWMDEIGLSNADEFWKIVDQHPHVRGILCGHIHQQLDVMRGKVRVLATPSTCIQFKPNRDDFQLDVLSPGYRWLDLLADGHIDTGVERVHGFIPPNLKDNSFY